MITNVETIGCATILDITKTEGSTPLKVLGRDGNIYYLKASEAVNGPFTDLISEIIGNYFCKCWELQSPNQSLLTLRQDIFDGFIKDEQRLIPSIYQNKNFDDYIFYGSENITNASELDSYISFFKSKAKYRKFHSPMDFLKIATFDRWIGNIDRKPENPNVLISQIDKKFHFHPIDHSASFGHNPSLKNINEVHLHVEGSRTLIRTELANSILKFTPKKDVANFSNEVLGCINKCVENMGDIFKQVPSSWGFSKKAKENIFSILSNEERNKSISHSLTSL